VSHPSDSMLEIFIAKYVPCLDDSPKDKYLIVVLQSNLYVGAQFELCFKHVIALEDSKVILIEQQ
jgi:hypothetical protein